MPMSTFQKVTLVSCVLLCVALLLPKLLLSGGRGDAARAEGTTGRFPPMLQRKPVVLSSRAAGGSRPHNPEAIARAKGSTTAAGKSNLAGQIIPVYGFGILLYILYIIFKITSKGKGSIAQEQRVSGVRSENMKRKITDFELLQLQERLKETEEVMEKIVSKARTQSGDSSSGSTEGGVSGYQEEKLLLQLKEITRVMQEGRLVEGIPSETPDCTQRGEFTDNHYGDEIPKDWTHCCTTHPRDRSAASMCGDVCTDEFPFQGAHPDLRDDLIDRGDEAESAPQSDTEHDPVGAPEGFTENQTPYLNMFSRSSEIRHRSRRDAAVSPHQMN